MNCNDIRKDLDWKNKEARYEREQIGFEKDMQESLNDRIDQYTDEAYEAYKDGDLERAEGLMDQAAETMNQLTARPDLEDLQDKLDALGDEIDKLEDSYCECLDNE